MKLLIYSEITQSTLKNSLGLPQYSYFFVLDKFMPVLNRIGEVIVVESSVDVDRLYEQFFNEGESCVFICFSPPHLVPLNLRCPTICVFAWEFDSLPDEEWDESTCNNWKAIFKRLAGCIPLSTHTERVVRSSMGEDYPVLAIPVPVWSLFHDARMRLAASPKMRSQAFDLSSASVVDSRNYVFGDNEFIINNPEQQFRFPIWNGEPLRMSYGLDDPHHGYLGGFYPAENWGAWSRLPDPWILMPVMLRGRIQVVLECAGYGPNAGRRISLSIADETREFVLGGGFESITLEFEVNRPTNIIRFRGLSLDPVIDAVDPRTMGLGLKRIDIQAMGRAVDHPVFLEAGHGNTLCLDGVVYTSVFNPADHRKNWQDIVTAFCFAFRDCDNATLVFKITHRSIAFFLDKFHYLLEQCYPFKCRVIAIHGFFDDAQFERLIGATTYYVNASRCEGLCLPLMEFMSCGIPGIAPFNTAMEDYVDRDSHFLVDCSEEPTIWPQDPRQKIRTLQYRINWDSLVKAFQDSYSVAVGEQSAYMKLSARCQEKMQSFCSFDVVENKLRDFFRLQES